MKLRSVNVNCFWCGEKVGEKAVFKETEHEFTYDPCPICKGKIKTGVLVIESQAEPFYKGQQRFYGLDNECRPVTGAVGMFPTGVAVVLKEEVAKAIFPEASFKKTISVNHQVMEALLKKIRASNSPRKEAV